MAVLTKEDLWNRLKHREFAPVYLLFGAESYLRDLAAKTIADLLLANSSLREFNEIEHSLNTSKIQYALSDAEQFPMIDAYRVIKITDVVVSAGGNKDNLKEEDEETLLRYLNRPAETSIVIFIANELDKRRKISKMLLENSVAVEFTALQGEELRRWLREKVKESDADIEEKALNHLVAMTGDDARKLKLEIEKLAIAALPDKLITYNLVENLVPNTREIPNFDLTDHLLAGNKRRALQTLKKILDDGAEPLMLLGLLAYNFRRLLQTKELMNQGVERIEVARVMRLHPSGQREFLELARRNKTEKFTGIMQRIAEADLAIKTSKGGGGNAGSRMQIEMLVCELVNLQEN
ncbi:MAG TPA: DNA polymerase III subunit delta [Pyrinomonadaceae bacterium]|jgi:DNA polymerase-3 subunit delta